MNTSASIAYRLMLICISIHPLTIPHASAAITLAESDKPIIELLALITGGIGIFLIGIHYAGHHLREMAGGKFEFWVSKLASKQAGMAILGAGLGFLTQSGKAAAFILADLVQVKLLHVRQAAIIVFWGNVGCSLIVFASMLSVKVFALIVLGITALGITFHIPKRLVQAYGAIFGMAMIMYGLYLVKDGAAGIASGGWMPEFIETLRGTYLLSFSAGLLLTLMIQSNLAVMMIAIALASSGLLNLQETAVVMCGAQAGTGIITYIFSFHAKGTARQVVASQIAFDIVATLTFVSLFILEMALGLPLVLHLIQTLSETISTQVVLLALLFQFLSTLLLVAIHNPIYEWIVKAFPPSATETLSEPEYVHEKAADSPETGIMLIEKEQRRLLQRLPLYLEYAREKADKDHLKSPEDFHQAFANISTLIHQTLSSISRHTLNQLLAESVISTTKVHEQLVTLENYVYQISVQISRYQQNDRASELGRNMLESVDFLLFTAIDALESGETMDINTLASMTQDRGEMMTNLRKSYFNSQQQMTNEARSFVLDITMLLENVVKTLSRYGEILKNSESRQFEQL